MQYRDEAFGLLIRINYRPPRFQFYLATFTHLGAIFSIYYADLPAILFHASLVIILLSYFAFSFRFRRLRSQQVSPVLCLDRKNQWSLITKGNTCQLQLRPAAYVHPSLVILRFFDQSKKTWCFILNKENVDQQSFRRLRVRLLHGETITENQGWR